MTSQPDETSGEPTTFEEREAIRDAMTWHPNVPTTTATTFFRAGRAFERSQLLRDDGAECADCHEIGGLSDAEELCPAHCDCAPCLLKRLTAATLELATLKTERSQRQNERERLLAIEDKAGLLMRHINERGDCHFCEPVDGEHEAGRVCAELWDALGKAKP